MYTVMSANSSSFADHSIPPHLSSSNSSFHHLMSICYSSEMSIYLFSTLSINNLFLPPVFILVLYLGYQQLRRQRSISSAARSPSDIFTYHSITMQFNELLGLNLFFCGSYLSELHMLLVGMNVCSVTSFAQALFHLLTCAERYLAVVHPVTYLGLRQSSKVRIRNVSVGCVWLLSFGCLAALYCTSSMMDVIFYICVMVFLLYVMSFCSVSVLCALKHPRLGEVGGNREHVDQSKQRAFHAIMVTMGVLSFKFGGNLILNMIYGSNVLNPGEMCVLTLSVFGFHLPSNLVLPLLFLHRAGKLQCCKQIIESG